MEFTLLNVEVGLIFWSAVTFVILLIVLKKYLWGPLLENLDNRERTIREAMESAEEAQQKAEHSLEEYNKQLGEAREEVRQVVAKGKESAERMKAEIVEEANKKAEALIQQAKKEIEAERKETLKQVKQVVVDISIAAAEKMLKRDLKAEDHLSLIEETLQGMDKKA